MAINKITERELSQNLLDKIKNAGGKVKLIKKSTDITNATNTVAIGIPGFDKATDSMLIFKNTTLLNDDEFTISEDSKNIVKSEGNWNEINETMTFTFIVFKYVPELAPGEGLGLTEEQVIEIVKQHGQDPRIGDMNTLTTNKKDLIVNSINEIKSEVTSLNLSASNITFDDSTANLGATDIQNVVIKLLEKITAIESRTGALETEVNGQSQRLNGINTEFETLIGNPV